MIHPDDDAFDTFLRGTAPEPLADDGFVLRAMASVDHAARGVAVQRRPAPVAPEKIARALAAENIRHDAQARQWRSAIVGALVGFVLLVAAMALAPADASLTLPPLKDWFPLMAVMAIGALWTAWREVRVS